MIHHDFPNPNEAKLSFESGCYQCWVNGVFFLLTILCLLCFPDDNCRLSDYHSLKTKILDLHDKRYMESNIYGNHKDDMASRKQLVDMMFKRFDADNNGHVDASELSQVRALSKRCVLLLNEASLKNGTLYSTQSVSSMKENLFNLISMFFKLLFIYRRCVFHCQGHFKQRLTVIYRSVVCYVI